MSQAAAATALFTPLQLCLKASYEANRGNAITCNQNQMRELESETLVFGDLDIALEEIPFLCKFLSNREVSASSFIFLMHAEPHSPTSYPLPH